MTSMDFKAELLAALREEMVGIFKSELTTAMIDNLVQIKSELQSVKTSLALALRLSSWRWMCLGGLWTTWRVQK